MALVELRSVYKRYGATWALRGVTLVVERGGMCLLKGPNGSGKTTLLKIINGMARPTRGAVKVYGLDPWRSYPRVGRHISFLYEGVPLPWWMSGRSLIKWVSSLGRAERFEEVARKLGVHRYWERPASTYSSGMKKRILLLLSLGLEAEIYLLDEPFTLIDSDTLSKVVDMIRSLHEEGATLIVSSHMPVKEVEKEADQVVYLYNGSVERVDVR